MNTLFANLAAGLRLAMLGPVATGEFRCSPPQVAFLSGMVLALAFLAGVLLDGPALALGSDVVRNCVADVGVFAVTALLLALCLRQSGVALRVVVILLSLAPVALIGTLALHLGWKQAASGSGDAAPWLVASAFYVAWLLIVQYRGLALATGLQSGRLASAYVLYLGLSMLPALVAAPSLPHPGSGADSRVAESDEGWFPVDAPLG